MNKITAAEARRLVPENTSVLDKYLKRTYALISATASKGGRGCEYILYSGLGDSILFLNKGMRLTDLGREYIKKLELDGYKVSAFLPIGEGKVNLPVPLLKFAIEW